MAALLLKEGTGTQPVAVLVEQKHGDFFVARVAASIGKGLGPEEEYRMKRIMTAAIAIVAIFGMASSASALSVLQVSVSPTFAAGPLTLEVTDNGVGDLNPTNDVVLNIATPATPFNGFSYSATTGTSSEGAAITSLFLNVQDVSRSATGAFDTIYFRFTDNNLVLPEGSPMMISSAPSSNDDLPLPVSVRFQAFADPNNALFGTSFALPDYTCAYVVAGNTGSCSATRMGQFNRTGPYSLTNYMAITLQQGNQLGNASISTAVTAVPIPEPGSMLLLGSGLAAAAAAARRRRAAKAQA